MTPEHDATTGRIRCDDAALGTLVADRGARPASVVEDPRTTAALDAVGDALVSGRMVAGGPAGVLDHRFWVAPAGGAFFLDLGDGRSDLVGVPATHVPARLARLARLRPRKIPAERDRREVDADLLADVLDASDLRRGSALTVLGADVAWRLDVRGSVADPGAVRAMTVLDGADGFWLVVGASPAVLEPTTPTVLWRRLAGLLA